MKDAIHEYRTKNDLLDAGNEHVYFTGPFQCFCKAEKKSGKSASEVYSVTSYDEDTD